MECRNCGQLNGSDARFCSNCGSALVVACPSCGTEASAAAAFCSSCGSELSAAPSGLSRYIPDELMQKLDAARKGRSMVGERRTVTMLFADLKGSTAAAETMDPEEWADIVNGVFTHLIKPVYRYEGTLARLMGDAVLAFFGAPIAHEDDPERAILAGLAMLRDARPYAREIQRQHGIDLDLRVGVHTGLVVVGEVGSDLRVEYTALGDAVNLAARMEQTAAPGTLQITGETKQLVEGLFEFESLGGIEVKGKAVPVASFRVTGVRERPVTTRGLGADSPFVGRSSEIASLREVVQIVRAGGGAIASVVGEAGAGKTRLVATVEKELEAASCTTAWVGEPALESLRWGRARCLSFDTAVPYAPFVDFFTRVFGTGPDDPPEIARARIEAAVESLPDCDPETTVPYLCALLGVDPGPRAEGVIAAMEAPELQRRTFAAVRGWFEACLAGSPGMLVLEDLHWADKVSLSLVEELLDLTERAPLGIILLMRPYKDDGSWGIHETAVRAHEHRYRAIRLDPLDPAAQRELVTALLTDVDPEGDLVEAIVERSGGNPFFLEELVRLRLEGNGADAPGGLPETVTALLTARLDRLGPDARLVAQYASVLGREFRVAELRPLVGDGVDVEGAVRNLLVRGILEERARIPELELAFRHALTKEAAYGSMLLKTRRRLHGEVAERLIEGEGETAAIAQHLVAANQGPRAVPYLVAAGDLASRAMALSDAIALYRQAGEWLTDPPDTGLALRIHEGLGAAYGLIPNLTEVSATYQRLLEVGRSAGEASLQVTALNRLGFAEATLGGNYADATSYLDQAKELAERVSDHMGLAEYHMAACMIATARGDMETAAAHDAQTARLGETLGAGQLLAGGLIQRVMSLAAAVRFDEAAEALEHAKRATEGVEDPAALIGISMAEHFVRVGQGRIREAYALVRDTADLALRVGSSQAAYAHAQAGTLAGLLGDYETSIAYLAQALRLGEESHQSYHAARAAAGLVGKYVQMGRDDEFTEGLRAKALVLLEAPMGSMTASSVYGDLGWAAIERGRDRDAIALFETALAGSSSTRHVEEPSLRLGLALARWHVGDRDVAVVEVETTRRFLDDRGLGMYEPVYALVAAAIVGPDDPEAALDALTEAGEECEAMGMRWLSWRIQGARALMLAGAGRLDAADEARGRARSVIDAIAADIADEGLRQQFSQHALGRLAAIVSPAH